MAGYPPPGPPLYYGHYPPHPPHPPHAPHLPPGSFTYLPQAYTYHTSWQQPYIPPYQPPQSPMQHFPPPPSQTPPYGVNVAEQPYDPPKVVETPPETSFTPNESIVSWIPATPNTAQDLEYKAVVGGREGYDGSPLWVIRAHHMGELIPGKLAIKHRYAFIPNLGKEIPVHNFEVLCTKPGGVKWISSKNGKVPENAVVAGNTINAEPLYIGRVSHKSSLTPGKVQPALGCCYISYGGTEISFRKYEVLCEVV
ncbi:trithorax group protein osa-like [Amyelois transitella]|uniref:trithorax group protein osa-like n=1 Tax=Amyelois transitella TaxID=680683 RepID=UPI0029904B74|nr:trithorax group protein osa-like [Amyelois transitella]